MKAAAGPAARLSAAYGLNMATAAAHVVAGGAAGASRGVLVVKQTSLRPRPVGAELSECLGKPP